MLRKSKVLRVVAVASAVSISSLAPSVPAAAYPNCHVTAYLICKDGNWQNLGYFSEEHCQEVEYQLCYYEPLNCDPFIRHCPEEWP